MRSSLVLCLAAAAAAAACSPPAKPPHHEIVPQKKAGARTISIIGTNDLHGAIERLPMLAGFINNLRAARAADGGGVLLVDAGDLFQGTLESNIVEGKDIVTAYNQMGYAASAIGNHEFDYGPEGPQVIARTIEDDPRGALKARAREAKFPFLATNINDAKSNARIKWPNMVASTVVEVGGVKIGIVGGSTESTPHTTMPANFAGLVIAPPAKAIADEAANLRKQGAQIIVAAVHIGSACKDLSKPNDLSSCDTSEELFKMIGDLPKGAVDVIVAGHTHAGIAHRIDDISVIESFSSGRAFGRVDLRVSPDGHVTASHIMLPHELCPADTPPGGGEKSERAAVPIASCKPGEYEGKPVVPDVEVQKIVDVAVARADERRKEKLGPTLPTPITRAYGSESAEGNLFCDLMLAAQPSGTNAEIALTNGGGLRADIPAGDLTYGGLFEAMPFDNRFAIVEMKGSAVRRLVTTNLQRGGGIFSWGGIAAKARCNPTTKQLDVDIKVAGKALADKATYKLVTSDFLASGGDGVIGKLKLPDGAITMTEVIIREAMADLLRKKPGQTLDAAKLMDPKHRRLDYEGARPVTCGTADHNPPKTPQEPD